MNTKQMDVWELIQNGHFEQACEVADAEFNQTKNIFPLRNKVFALFHLEKYEDAFMLTQQLIEYRKGETSADFLFSGIAKWMLNEKNEAVLLWRRAEQCMYKDAAGGIEVETILYFASINTEDTLLKTESIKKIKKILKSKRSINWPGPLGSYLIGNIDEAALLSYVSNISILKERHLCQAYFVIAINELEKGNVDGYREKLIKSVSNGPPSYLEHMYYLAKGELKFFR